MSDVLLFPLWMSTGNDDRAIHDQVPEGAFHFKDVDFCCQENGTVHRTDRFAMMSKSDGPTQLVVRRGQEFMLKMKANRPLDLASETVTLILWVDTFKGEVVSPGHGTVVYLTLETGEVAAVPDATRGNNWSARLQSQEQTGQDALLTIQIQIAVTASVSKWKIEFITNSTATKVNTSFALTTPFYVLFNPWHEQDAVYMEDEAWRDEYVLNDTTLIFKGTQGSIYGSVWKLGQYDKDILEASLYLIAVVGRVSATYRGNVAKVARAISGVVNANDDSGVVVGKWFGDFSDGVQPNAWVGSVNILQKYYNSNVPVRYGQCWVYGGVTGTVARALGIPSRIITAYKCAHDSNASLTLDFYYDDNINELKRFSKDSTWNFHVWNEMWMTRPDLGSKETNYDGWQVVDSTPQELSDGMYRLGPAPVAAVKEGEVHLSYDVNFVFAEVNADIRFWRHDGSNKSLQLLQMDTITVGWYLSTKAVGSWERQDVTLTYKYPEGSSKERSIMAGVMDSLHTPFRNRALKVPLITRERTTNVYDCDSMHFKMEFDENTQIGEPFVVTLRAKNDSKDYRRIKGQMKVDEVLYTGRTLRAIKGQSFDVSIPANSENLVKLHVKFEEYFGGTLGHTYFKVTGSAKIEGSAVEFFALESCRLLKPKIDVAVDGKAIQRASVKVNASLKNPLKIPLTEGKFTFQCSGVHETLVVTHDMIEVDGTATVQFFVIPSLLGESQVVAKFSCKEVDDLEGYTTFSVESVDTNTTLHFYR